MVSLVQRIPVDVWDIHGCNVGSVCTALEMAGARPRLRDPKDPPSDSPLVLLPGMSSPSEVKRSLPTDLRDRLRSPDSEGPLVLAICMGLHMLFESSDEHEAPESNGISLFDGRVRRLDTLEDWISDLDARLPHVGWRSLTPTDKISGPETPTLVKPTSTFYFAHSFGVPYLGQPFVQQTVKYGGVSLCLTLLKGASTGSNFIPR